ncbi:acetolactate synthase large subunit [Arthrobacter sp. StoSoilB5]|uniref:acetolactate synthase large subunit n=1 Tax=Arthrobacter sp. StoSoilB5 TaxID=2830992 RepID=UPI001CC74F10|nr:acetolactate synthase large subunit [Arthrobacter sp. StoSoilB5]BCW44687.1 acetolactate synthase [Arthrobacter sp. StoSoilB5]
MTVSAQLVDSQPAQTRNLPRQGTGADSVVWALEALGVDIVFGIPGGAILPVYDPLMQSSRVRHILVRHEQDAGHAAAGYAQASGRVGVCMATSGPGATNLLTPLADAHMDSVPVVAITGQVSSSLIGKDAFQEADIIGMTMSVTKHGFHVTEASEIPRALAEAFHVAASGRPGVVVVDIPKDVLQESTEFNWPPVVDLPGYSVPTSPPQSKIREATELINCAESPVLYVGGGVIKAQASRQLLELAELTGIPVVTTLMARGAFPDSHPLHYGMPGMHGSVAAVAAMQRSDLLIALGARFDDRVTGRPESFAPTARVLHIDIDPAEIGKNRRADVGIVGDCREVLRALLKALAFDRVTSPRPELAAWRTFLDSTRASYPTGYESSAGPLMAPQLVIETIGRATGSDTIYAAGVGQHQMWAAHHIEFEQPRTWLNSGGLGTMGYAVPAAMGAKLAFPEREVWAIDGDGCFQMTGRELATAAIEGIPIKVAIINNGMLGMVRQLQAIHYDERFTQVDLGTHRQRVPDFVLLAEALGCAALRCERAEDLHSVIEQARSINDRPVVIDFVVSDQALVWPMVAAGTSNDQIMAAKDVRPLFNEGDDA